MAEGLHGWGERNKKKEMEDKRAGEWKTRILNNKIIREIEKHSGEESKGKKIWKLG